ncbi:MAG: FecR domain-containing protein [Kiritimatiellae bacterium]|nr:FecR domain-containing protein [Kiritimatiellia bacterium]
MARIPHRHPSHARVSRRYVRAYRRRYAARAVGKKRWRWQYSAMAIGALILVGLGFVKRLFTIDMPDVPLSVAMVHAVRADVFAGPARLKVLVDKKKELFPGYEVETIGSNALAAITYPDLARLDIEGEGVLRIDPRPEPPAERAGSEPGPHRPAVRRLGRAVFLAHGKLSADIVAQEAAPPFHVATPHADMRVDSAKFSVLALAEGTRVEVGSGAVRINRGPAGEPVTLGQGETLSIEAPPPQTEPVQNEPAAPSAAPPE